MRLFTLPSMALLTPRSAPRWLPVTFTLLLLTGTASAQAPAGAEPGLAPARLERWLDDGDTALITQSFRRHPEQVLAFFDNHLETAMKMMEQRAAYEDVMKEMRKGLRFGQLASEAFRDPIFGEYAANFASWSDAERRNFRAGQQAYRSGARALRDGRSESARDFFQQSLDLAEPLGDAWGMQMSLRGLAQANFALGEWQAASDTSIRAMDLSARLQLRTDEIEQALLCAEARHQLKTPDSGLGHARLAWSKLKRTDPPALRQKAGDALAAALERTGRPEEAAKIREEACAPAAKGEGEGEGVGDSATPASDG
ncbi:MAG: hypothetical protein KF724_10565 [Phycisphaeraceae bacterium]|nr:hypothetical protein [Phycisphaeraceae bacterium]